jgi:hypothetical protein
MNTCELELEVTETFEINPAHYVTLYTGTTAPDNSLGEDGDVYLMYAE